MLVISREQKSVSPVANFAKMTDDDESLRNFGAAQGLARRGSGG